MGKKTIASANANFDTDVREINGKGKETQFLTVGLPNIDGTYDDVQYDVDVYAMRAVAKQVIEKNPHLSFVLIGAGRIHVPGDALPTHCSLYAHSANPLVNEHEWLQACGVTNPEESFGIVPCEYPLKEKDNICTRSCNYLRKLGLLHDEEDEMIPFDINAD